jgi:catechol 2,3-dioxygenase-like lactoylglutathione lyase family enzyme
MDNTSIVFDHIHLISKDPQYTASWYEEKLGGKIISDNEVLGAPQIFVAFEGAIIIVRGQRPGEETVKKEGLTWGTDHFGFQVHGDFDAYCDALKKKGVHFTVEPRDFSPTSRIAFIEAPDGVNIELLIRKK